MKERALRKRLERKLQIAEESLRRLDGALRRNGVRLDTDMFADVRTLMIFFEERCVDESSGRGGACCRSLARGSVAGVPSAHRPRPRPRPGPPPPLPAPPTHLAASTRPSATRSASTS